MRYIFSFLLITAIMFLFYPDKLSAQGTDTLSVDGEEVIELDITEIKITIEKPQVMLFSDRIKPEFDDVHLEKSFVKEIIGEGERFEFEESKNKENIRRIDVDKMLKKLR